MRYIESKILTLEVLLTLIFQNAFPKYAANLKSTLTKLISLKILDEYSDLKFQLKNLDDLEYLITKKVERGVLHSKTVSHVRTISKIATNYNGSFIDNLTFNQAFTYLSIKSQSSTEYFDKKVASKNLRNMIEMSDKPSLGTIQSYYDNETIFGHTDNHHHSMKPSTKEVWPDRENTFRFIQRAEKLWELRPGELTNKFLYVPRPKKLEGRMLERTVLAEIPKVISEIFEIYSSWKTKRIIPDYLFDMVRRTPDDKPWTYSQKAGVCATRDGALSNIKKICDEFNNFKKRNADSINELYDEGFINYFYNSCIENKIYTTGIACLSLLKQETNPFSFWRFYLPLLEEIDSQEWQKTLNRIAPEIKSKIRLMSAAKKAEGGDVEGHRNISFILESDDPLKIFKAISSELKDMVEIADDLSKKMNIAKDWLVFILSISVPLRELNWAEMLYMKNVREHDFKKIREMDRVSALCEVVDAFGEFQYYRIFVTKTALKTRSSSRVQPVEVNLIDYSSEVNGYIDIREAAIKSMEEDGLKNINKGSLFISGDSTAGKNTPGKKLNGLNTFKENTRKAIARAFPHMLGEEGINIHGIRHLSASMFLIFNSGQYSRLSTLLGDTLETVIRVYAHTAENINRKMNSIYSSVVKREGDHDEIINGFICQNDTVTRSENETFKKIEIMKKINELQVNGRLDI